MKNLRGMGGPALRGEILAALDEEIADWRRLFALIFGGGVIASLGLIEQNAALLAAAVLFTPASPLFLAAALSVVRADLPRLGTSLLRLPGALVLAVAAGLVVGVLARAANVSGAGDTAILLLPAQPSVLSALAALVVGGLAAYALVQPRIPGIAVDAAVTAVMLPPACLIGLGAALRQTTVWHEALWQVVMSGSALTLAAAVFFAGAGYRPVQVTQDQVNRLPAPVGRFLMRAPNLHLILMLPLALVLAVTLVHASSLNRALATSTILTTATATPSPSPTALSTSIKGSPTAIATRVHGATSPTATAVGPAISLTAVSHPTVTATGGTAVALPGGTAVVVNTGGHGVHMRATAGLTAPIALTIPEGATVSLTGKRVAKDGYTWVQVRTSGGKTGWVSDLYLQVQ